MKTTIELSDGLLAEAKSVVARQGGTLRSLIEAALRAELDRRHASEGAPFVLADLSVGDPSVAVEWDRESWQRVLEQSYEGRGA